jgi:hypothetical protein
VLLILLAWVAWECRERRRLDQAIGLEKRHAGEAIRLRSGNAALAAEIARLARMREAQRKVNAAEASAQAAAGKTPGRDGFIAVQDLANLGTANVHDLFETYLWAVDHLDTAALAKLLYLPQQLREKLDAFYAGLPPEEQARYGSAEGVYALIYAAAVPPTYYSGIQVASPEPPPGPSGNFSPIQVNYEYSDGRIRTHSDWYSVRTAAGWKLFPGNAISALNQFFGPTGAGQN